LFEVPYNETHSYWLAWYWVEEENKTWWWSYGINGSKLCVNTTANVTLHYVLGLKELPYVLDYGWWAGEWYEVYKKDCKFWAENLSLMVEGDEGAYSARLYVKLSEDFGWVAVELKALKGSFDTRSLHRLGYVYPAGQYVCALPMIEVPVGSKGSLTLINLTAMKSVFYYWWEELDKYWEEWVPSELQGTESPESMVIYEDAVMDMVCRPNWSVTYLTYINGKIEFGSHYCCGLSPLSLCSYPDCKDLFKLPNWEGWYLFCYYCVPSYVSRLERMALIIKGVAPP